MRRLRDPLSITLSYEVDGKLEKPLQAKLVVVRHNCFVRGVKLATHAMQWVRGWTRTGTTAFTVHLTTEPPPEALEIDDDDDDDNKVEAGN